MQLGWSGSANSMFLLLVVNGQNVLDGGSDIATYFTHDQSEMATFKIKWKSGDIQVKLNETVVITDTGVFSGLSIPKLSLNRVLGGNEFEGNIQYIKVYDSIDDF